MVAELSQIRDMYELSFVPRPPPFLSSVCIHNNTRGLKTSEKRGRLGSIHHVNDIRWM